MKPLQLQSQVPLSQPQPAAGRSRQTHSPRQPQRHEITLGRPHGCPATRHAVCALQTTCRRAPRNGCSRWGAFSRFIPLAALQRERQGAAPALCPPPPRPPAGVWHPVPRAPGARRHKHPPSKQDAFSHGANISGTTGNVQLDYNALRKGHGEISALYLELCLLSAG